MTASNGENRVQHHADRCVAALENEELELTEWEEKFLRSCLGQIQRLVRELTDKQLAVLIKIEDAIINGRPER